MSKSIKKRGCHALVSVTASIIKMSGAYVGTRLTDSDLALLLLSEAERKRSARLSIKSSRAQKLRGSPMLAERLRSRAADCWCFELLARQGS